MQPTLSILDFDEARKRLVLRLRQGALAGQGFEVALGFCPHPLCACAKLTLTCVPIGAADTAEAAAPASKLWFVLELGERQLAQTEELEQRPESLALAQAVIAELEPGDWGRLFGTFVAAKQKQSLTADCFKLDAEFPARVVAGEVVMVGYSQLFPFDMGFGFEVGDVFWCALDQYCVNLQCRCHDVMLVMVPAVKDPDDVRGRGPMPTVCFDYLTGEGKPVELPRPGEPSLAGLLEELKREHPELRDAARLRHMQLRVLRAREVARLMGSPLPAPAKTKRRRR